MGVVSLKDWKKNKEEKALDAEKPALSYFEENIRRNKLKEERLRRERSKNNRSVTSYYGLKK